jgi:hypothetical protein
VTGRNYKAFCTRGNGIIKTTKGRGLVFISGTRDYSEPFQHIEKAGNFSFLKLPIQY